MATAKRTRAQNSSPSAIGAPSSAREERGTDDIPDSERRVRIPYFPLYSEVRLLLPVWSGKPRSQITHMHSTVAALLGTPQDPADWTSPDEWIPARLTGADLDMATAIWERTGKRVNPRRTYGHWLLATNYGLLEDTSDARVTLSARGKTFVERQGSEAEAVVDEGEGLLKLLSLVGEQGPTRPKELLKGWGDYLKRRSGFGSDSTIKDSLHRRLRNLLEREFVTRSAGQYSITDDGLAHLKSHVRDIETAPPSGELHKLLSLAKSHRNAVRDSVKQMLSEMDPIGFEHLVKRLLEAMDYQNVKVTERSNDKGIDVVADIELGITSVREVVQAKRHALAVQRKDLDALRGCLHRFRAVRGTLITTGTFAKGTRDAAFEVGVAPITLIDGEKLLDLLVEYEVGFRKKTIELLELDSQAFTDSEHDAAVGAK